MKYLKKISFFKKEIPNKIKKIEIEEGDFVTLKNDYKNDSRYGKIYQVMFNYSKEYTAVHVKDVETGEETFLLNKEIEIVDDNEFLQDIKNFNL